MGGTLPVLSKLFIREFGRLGAGIGSLYGTNTLGAVVGTFSAGFFFIILFGAKETTYIAGGSEHSGSGRRIRLEQVCSPATSGQPANSRERR